MGVTDHPVVPVRKDSVDILDRLERKDHVALLS